MRQLFVCLLVFCLLAPVCSTFASSPQGDQETVSVSSLTNVNQATVKELVKLPGIGKVTAEKIVAYRDLNGPFAAAEDLLKVNGVGKQTLAKIRDQITVQ